MEPVPRGRHRVFRSTIVAAAVATMLVSPAGGAAVTKARLENAANEPQNWLLGVPELRLPPVLEAE